MFFLFSAVEEINSRVLRILRLRIWPYVSRDKKWKGNYKHVYVYIINVYIISYYSYLHKVLVMNNLSIPSWNTFEKVYVHIFYTPKYIKATDRGKKHTLNFGAKILVCAYFRWIRGSCASRS